MNNSLMNNLTHWWQELSASQRRTFSVAIPILLLLVAVLVLQPMFSNYQQSKQRYDQLLSSYHWLAQQQSIGVTVPAICNGLPLLERSSARSVMDQQLSDRTLVNPQWQETPQGWTLNLKDVDGSILLQWLEQITCQGAILESLALDALEPDSLTISASIEISLL